MSCIRNIFKSKTPAFGPLGNLFNSYNAAINEASEPTDDSIDVEVRVRIRLFGNNTQKQKAWEEYQKQIGVKWGPVSWANVSSTPQQIWGDLRKRGGEIFINKLALGHELVHSLKILDQRVMNPDKYAQLG
ncbi:MAG TPA: hypothetical protein ACFYD4_08110 [Candidatus Wunengus sp. YC61]|uniref:hypothetical protein n=1 Tax=Candidatus Wunengus sp. YC61 TaxID=3367698 RepID=UPI0040286DD8